MGKSLIDICFNRGEYVAADEKYTEQRRVAGGRGTFESNVTRNARPNFCIYTWYR